MSYTTLELQGSVTAGGNTASSGQPTIAMAIQERMTALSTITTKYTLSSDSVQTVSLGALSNINFLSIRTVGGKVKARISSSDGSTQSIPVDPILILRSDSINITALDLTRLAGNETEVYIVLAERA